MSEMTSTGGMGEVVRVVREELKWSQEALAAAANVSPRTIQRLERGEPAAIERIEAVARAFGVTSEALHSTAAWRRIRPTMLRLDRVQNGREMVSLVREAEGFRMVVTSDEDDLHDVARQIAGAADDWSGIVDDWSAVPSAHEHLGLLLDELHALEAKCFARLEKAPWRLGNGQSIELSILTLLFCPESYACIFEDETGEYALAKTPATMEALETGPEFARATPECDSVACDSMDFWRARRGSNAGPLAPEATDHGTPS